MLGGGCVQKLADGTERQLYTGFLLESHATSLVSAPIIAMNTGSHTPFFRSHLRPSCLKLGPQLFRRLGTCLPKDAARLLGPQHVLQAAEGFVPALRQSNMMC